MDPLTAVVALGAAAGGFVQGLSGFAFRRVVLWLLAATGIVLIATTAAQLG